LKLLSNLLLIVVVVVVVGFIIEIDGVGGGGDYVMNIQNRIRVDSDFFLTQTRKKKNEEQRMKETNNSPCLAHMGGNDSMSVDIFNV